MIPANDNANATTSETPLVIVIVVDSHPKVEITAEQLLEGDKCIAIDWKPSYLPGIIRVVAYARWTIVAALSTRHRRPAQLESTYG